MYTRELSSTWMSRYEHIAVALFECGLDLADCGRDAGGYGLSGCGRVVDEANRPVAGVKVEWLNEREQASASSDGSGRFVLRLPRKPRDMFLVRATHADGAEQAFAAFAVDDSYKTPLSRFLPDGQIGLPDELRLVLRPAKKIEPVVVDGRQQPIAGGI